MQLSCNTCELKLGNLKIRVGIYEDRTKIWHPVQETQYGDKIISSGVAVLPSSAINTIKLCSQHDYK